MKRIVVLLIATCLAACAAVPSSERTGITFVHLNDTYRVGDVESGTAGGFSRVVTVVRDLQANGRDVHILHGGDFLYPSLESQLWDGLQMVDAMNFMDSIAPMHVVAGNHEFDRRGPEQLVAALKASEFDWIGDNYSFDTGDAAADALLKSAHTIESGGRTIGMFSLTLHADDGGNARSYLSIDKDYLAAAKRVIEQFEADGVDAIIGVTHLHMWQDEMIARLKRDHPSFVFVVGGHDHEPEYSPATATSAAVMKGASNARVIWTIDLEFDANGLPFIRERKVELNASVVPDADYQVLADRWREQLMQFFPFLEAHIGTAAVPLNAREEQVRTRETNWGNFITDQMLGAFGEPADLAFINSGTLRIDDTISGDITFEDIGRTFGFSSFLRYTTVTGAEFIKVMEAGFRGAPAAQGYFPQVAGFRVCVDRTLPEFDRIVSLQLPTEDGWSEIEADEDYMLVVPDFLFRGGDGYDVPKDRPASLPGSELKYLVLDAILHAQGAGQPVGKPIDPRNPRIKQLLEPKEPCWN
ncbi:MAG: 5'-nucleotidase C-terminal domain-containing protein [Pseudomonadota bacterium]